jgi:uncharacterized protein (DUF169 family)
MVRGNAKQMMLLAEATNAAGLLNTAGVMGRPTCAAIPAILNTQQYAMSLGCIGNRVYNELDDEELYTAIVGTRIADIIEKLALIVQANSDLEKFHLARVI